MACFAEVSFAALNRQDVHRTETGFAVHIHKSKANKGGPREVVVYPNFGEGSAASVLDLHLTQTQHLNHKVVNLQTHTHMKKVDCAGGTGGGRRGEAREGERKGGGGQAGMLPPACPPDFGSTLGGVRRDRFPLFAEPLVKISSTSTKPSPSLGATMARQSPTLK